MSRLAEFRKLEQSLAAQLAELEAMKGSSELQRKSNSKPSCGTSLLSMGAACLM